MITLTESWNSGLCIFPAGTIFIFHKSVKRRRIYTYATPDGGHGQIILGSIPGQ